jgi:hypothetical protein
MSYGKTIEQMGIEKGWRQAIEGLILRFLQRQFGELNEEVKAAIQVLSLDRVTRLSEAMFDFESFDDLVLWFRTAVFSYPEHSSSSAKRDLTERFEGERKMPNGLTVERRGFEKGREQGLQQGLQLGAVEVVRSLLQLRLGKLSEETQLAVRTLTFKKVRELSRVMLDFNSTSDLATWLRKNASSK